MREVLLIRIYYEFERLLFVKTTDYLTEAYLGNCQLKISLPIVTNKLLILYWSESEVNPI